MLSYHLHFPKIFSYDLLRQYINIVINYNLLVQYVVLYVFRVFFRNTLKSVNFQVVKLSRFGGKRTIKSHIHRFNNIWDYLG